MAVGLNDFAFSAPARGVLLSGGSLQDGLRYTLTVNQPRRIIADMGSSPSASSTSTLLFTSPVGTGQKGSMNGGFVGADYQFALRYMTYLRYDHATSRSPLGRDQEQGPTLGIVGQLTPTWQLQLEYQHRQEASNQWNLSSRFAF